MRAAGATGASTLRVARRTSCACPATATGTIAISSRTSSRTRASPGAWAGRRRCAGAGRRTRSQVLSPPLVLNGWARGLFSAPAPPQDEIDAQRLASIAKARELLRCAFCRPEPAPQLRPRFLPRLVARGSATVASTRPDAAPSDRCARAALLLSPVAAAASPAPLISLAHLSLSLPALLFGCSAAGRVSGRRRTLRPTRRSFSPSSACGAQPRSRAGPPQPASW